MFHLISLVNGEFFPSLVAAKWEMQPDVSSSGSRALPPFMGP